MYQPSDAESEEEFSNGAGDGEGEEVMAATACELPCVAWDGLWDSLIYADNIKLKLLDYIHATLVLSDANVDREFRLLWIVLLTQQSCSERHFMESRSATAWSTWNRENISVSRTCTKTIHSSITSVRFTLSIICGDTK